MEKDRKFILDTINTRFAGVNLWKIFPVSADKFVDDLERYVEMERVQAIGWTVSDDCVDLDEGRDPRQKDLSSMLKRAEKDLSVPDKND